MGLSPYTYQSDSAASELLCVVILNIIEVTHKLKEMLLSPLKRFGFFPQHSAEYEYSNNLVKKLKRRNPTLRYKNLSEIQGLKCTVCLDEIDKNALVHPLPCDHIFHASCLHKSVSHSYDTCPLCRTFLILPKREPQRRRMWMPFM